jgi:hypothetical protein
MLWIEGTTHALSATLKDMRLDHGGADALVAQEFLNGANIIAIFQQMGREAMPLMLLTALAP